MFFKMSPLILNRKDKCHWKVFPLTVLIFLSEVPLSTFLLNVLLYAAFKERIFWVRTAVDQFSSHLTTTSLNGCRLLLNPTHSSHSRLLLLSGVYFLARWLLNGAHIIIYGGWRQSIPRGHHKFVVFLNALSLYLQEGMLINMSFRKPC